VPAPKSNAFRVLGDRLLARRLELGVSQRTIADLASLDTANYGRIERGHGNPNFETLVRLAGVLGIDPGELVTGIKLKDLPTTKPSYTAAEFIRERDKRA
jgi:transcriptional regulator with XRE-family HTH domain